MYMHIDIHPHMCTCIHVNMHTHKEFRCILLLKSLELQSTVDVDFSGTLGSVALFMVRLSEVTNAVCLYGPVS